MAIARLGIYLLDRDVLNIDLQKLRERAKVLIFDDAMTFEELNVENERGLIEKYFDFSNSQGWGTLKFKYYDDYTFNPAFIALLIDLGYDVVWGDYVPNLNIFTRPFISTFSK